MLPLDNVISKCLDLLTASTIFHNPYVNLTTIAQIDSIVYGTFHLCGFHKLEAVCLYLCSNLNSISIIVFRGLEEANYETM